KASPSEFGLNGRGEVRGVSEGKGAVAVFDDDEKVRQRLCRVCRGRLGSDQAIRNRTFGIGSLRVCLPNVGFGRLVAEDDAVRGHLEEGGEIGCSSSCVREGPTERESKLIQRYWGRQERYRNE